MQQITPFFWFKNQAEEALEFYAGVFSDGKVLSRHTVPGMGFLTGSFSALGLTFYVLNGANEPFTPATSFMIDCKNQEEVDYYWDKFMDGGKPLMCGWITDKYGVSWQVIPAALPKLLYGDDKERAQRVMQAMMKMQKIEVKTIEEA